MDEDQLTPQMIEQLIKYMPKPEQMSQLAELKSEYKTMAEPEQFAVVVSIMPYSPFTRVFTYKCAHYGNLLIWFDAPYWQVADVSSVTYFYVYLHFHLQIHATIHYIQMHTFSHL